MFIRKVRQSRPIFKGGHLSKGDIYFGWYLTRRVLLLRYTHTHCELWYVWCEHSRVHCEQHCMHHEYFSMCQYWYMHWVMIHVLWVSDTCSRGGYMWALKLMMCKFSHDTCVLEVIHAHQCRYMHVITHTCTSLLIHAHHNWYMRVISNTCASLLIHAHQYRYMHVPTDTYSLFFDTYKSVTVMIHARLE